MSLIEININNSFNKESSNANQEKITKNDSTLNKNLDSHIEVNSINVASLTNSAVNNQSGIAIGNAKHKTLIREILVGAAGSIVGSVITFIIMKFLR